MKRHFERLSEWIGQLEVLKTYYARLTERERYIVLGSIGGGVVTIMIIIYSALLAATTGLDRKIEKSRQNVRLMADLASQFSTAESQVRKLEQVIQRTPPSFLLSTHLEQLAGRNGVSIDTIKSVPAEDHELYRESQVSVSVRQVTLRTMINFLYDIENSRELLRITSLQIKPNFQDPTQLNVNFVVSTFASKEIE